MKLLVITVLFFQTFAAHAQDYPFAKRFRSWLLTAAISMQLIRLQSG